MTYVSHTCPSSGLIIFSCSNQARDEEVPQSFGKYLIERQKELELSDDETAYLAGSMFGAGSDTTASAISVAVMASACYPEAAERVRKELDSVIGKDRRTYIFSTSFSQLLTGHWCCGLQLLDQVIRKVYPKPWHSF